MSALLPSKTSWARAKPFSVEGPADGHLSASVALRFVFTVFGLWIFGANAFEVGVSHLVEDHAAVEA